MARARALMKLARLKFKRAARPVVFVGVAALGGGIGALSTGIPGNRKAQAVEGATSAALATAVGTIIFRRFRGRIIPIRRKIARKIAGG